MVTLRIAVADDEPDMRDYLARALPRLGHAVVAVAVNGRELVELCQQEQPQLIITDVRMPELDGIEAAARIWQHSDIPIVFLSAFHNEERLHAAAAEHVILNLEKPIKLAALGIAIECVHAKQQFMQHLLPTLVPPIHVAEIHTLLESALVRIQKQQQCDALTAIHYLDSQAITLPILQALAE